MVHQAADQQRFGDRETRLPGGHTFGQCPFQLQPQSRITGIFPIAMPAGLWLKDKSERYIVAGRGLLCFGNQLCRNVQFLRGHGLETKKCERNQKPSEQHGDQPVMAFTASKNTTMPTGFER